MNSVSKEETFKRVFFSPHFFEYLLKAEWTKPMANCQFPHFVKKRMYTNLCQWDSPCSCHPFLWTAVWKWSWNSMDKRANIALKKTHGAPYMAIKVPATAFVLSRPTITWICKIVQLIPAVNWRLLDGTNRVLKANAFPVDAILDTQTSDFSPKAMALAATAGGVCVLAVIMAGRHSFKNYYLLIPSRGIGCLERY